MLAASALLLCFCPPTRCEGKGNNAKNSFWPSDTVTSEWANAAASPHLHCDQAGQLQVALHHGEAAQEVPALGAKVWEFPGQDGEPATDGSDATVEGGSRGAGAAQPAGHSPASPFGQRPVPAAAAGQVGGFQRRQLNRLVVAIHHQLPIWSERGTALAAPSTPGSCLFPADRAPLTQSPAVHGAHPGAEGPRPAPHQLLQGLSEAALQGAEGGAGGGAEGGAALRHRRGVGVAPVLQLQAGSDVEQLQLVVLQPSRAAS